MKRQVTFCIWIVLSAGLLITPGRAQGTAPTILFSPTNRVSYIGGSATMSVTATGAPPLSYKWVKDGAAVPRGTNRFLSLINLTITNAGNYAAMVSNPYGSTTSQVASLTLTGAPPNIYLQPVDTLLCVGGPDSILVVQAGGSPPFSYHWTHDGVEVPGSNANRLSVPAIAANLGEYLAVVSNPYGAQTSAVARLQRGPIIVQQPTNTTVYAGTALWLTVEVETCLNPRFQWRSNGVDITGYSTNQTLFYPYALKEYEGDYTVVVSDIAGSVTSVVARLEVLERLPIITQQPADAMETALPVTFFRVEYSGPLHPHVQWRFNGENLPGATNAHLWVPSTPSNQGGYSAVLSNSGGSVTSRVAVLTLRTLPPVIETYGQPESQIVCSSDTNHPNLFVTVYEQGLCFFQWRKDGVAMPGETNSWLYLAKSSESFGSYTVVVTNYFGAVTSAVATVSVGPVIIEQPSELIEANVESSADLGVTVRSCDAVQFQWQRNGADVPGATNALLAIYPLSIADAGDYTVIILHSSGSLTSVVARLEVIGRLPEIDPDSPADQEIRAGDGASFNVASYELGAPAGTFQWWFNGAPIPGANDTYLEFTADSLRQQGRYFVVLSNEVGSVTSRVARLTLLFSLPYFEYEPEDSEVPAGTEAYFSAYAYGAPPPTYQWLFNGHPIRRETNSDLSLTVYGSNQIGGYSVVASNFLGSVTSRVAKITLLVSPPGFVLEPADRAARSGEYVIFSSIATGAPPPSYQWFLDGNKLRNETNNQLAFYAGFASQIGGYTVVADNGYGSTISRVARLDIDLVPPRFSFQPLAQSVVEGEHADIYFSLTNNTPAFVQWQRDGIDVPGATNNPLSLRSVTTNDIGGYRAIVWNDTGRATSAVARLEVRVVGPLDHWTWRFPWPQGNDLNAVAYGNGRHVAIGYGGGVVVSVAGTNWADAHQPGQVRRRESLVFGNGVFLTLDGVMPQTSTNGVDWMDRDYWGAGYSTALAFGNGRFVAAAVNNTGVGISTNGVDWEIHDDVWMDWLAGLTYAGGMFVASGGSAEHPGLYGIYTSTDGVDWVERFTLAADVVGAVAYGAGKFVAVPSYYLADYIITSTNGIDWVEEPLPQARDHSVYSLAWGNGVWVAVGYPSVGREDAAAIMYSTDALHWTPAPGVGTNSVSKVLFDGTRFVAVGPYGFLATSVNGTEWSVTNPGSDLNLRGITHANGLFVTVGNAGLIYTSADGRAWSRRESGTVGNLRSVTWFHDRFIIVGGDDDMPGSAIVLSSTDGVLWQPQVASGSLYGVAHNGERLVAVGNAGVIVTSLDGIQWADVASSPTIRDLNVVAWANERFVAVGKNGTVIVSTNGLDWSSTGTDSGKNLKGIAYGNGVYVAVGNGGRLLVGPEATSWLRGVVPFASDFEDITFGGGRFLAVGVNGGLHTSVDGTNWVRRVTVCENDLRGVIHVEGSFYVAGNNETIIQSGQADAALRITRLSPSSEVQVQILGEAGRAYRLQGSPDLTQWTDLRSLTAGPEPTRYTNNAPGASQRRFYRVVTP